MELTKTKFGWKQVILVSGTYLSLYIGSGFATGQEAFQYFGSQGIMGIVSAIITAIILVFVARSCFKLGSEKGITEQSDVFRYYAGKYLGIVFDWYTVVVLFFLYGVIIAGGGATLTQFIGVPSWVGIAILAVLSIACVVLGLKRMVDVLGMLGPILSVAIVLIAIAALVKSDEGVAAGNAALEAAKAQPDSSVLTATGHWFTSAVLCASGYTCTGLACLPAYGRFFKSKKEMSAASVAGPVGLMVAVAITALAMLANFTRIQGVQVPMLALAEYVAPWLGVIIAIAIVIAIFTTITPLLYGFSAKFAKDDKSVKFKIIAAISGLFAAFGGTLLPFGKLINILFPTIGYISGVMLVAVFIAIIRRKGFIDGPTKPAVQADTSN